ncbi:MAG: MFS transporter [Planctomycetaceae bacterium]|jgi:FSR family fosmidomycin resistance protein-like MFS transporter|nr:MFS transporter [Planctomycetaceae bacterium]
MPSPKNKLVVSSLDNPQYFILWSCCIAHLFNDTFQSIIPAAFPLLEHNLSLTLFQVGLIFAVFQFASSIFQPLIGWVLDRYPFPYALPLGMTSTLGGIIMLSQSHNFSIVLFSVVFIGVGSAVLHPEASRIVYWASGNRYGLAQSIFQVGGNTGSSLGPLIAAVAMTHQSHIIWFSILAIAAILWTIPMGIWYSQKIKEKGNEKKVSPNTRETNNSRSSLRSSLPKTLVYVSVFLLLLLVFSKNMYSMSLTIFLPFYLMAKYGVSVQASQAFLFAYLFAVAAGTLFGGWLGDHVGRKRVIWFSILGAAPFTLAMPYVNSLWLTCVLSMFIGAIMSSAFPAILIYAQELIPGNVGIVGGLFFGFSFGAGAIASSLLGFVADHQGLDFVYDVCSYLPLIGLLTWFLPEKKNYNRSRS